MTQPPLTNREYAYFAVAGPSTHEQITQLLGFSPSQAWNAGDRSETTGRVQKTMRWRLDSGLDDRQPLELHIHALLVMLATREAPLKQLQLEHDLIIQCVGYYPPSGHGTHLNREVVRQAARLGLSIDLDFYYQDAFGHDG